MIAISYQRMKPILGREVFAAYRRCLTIQSQAMPLEFAMLNEIQAVLAILQKFQFANEDIMRRYVNSQFTNFIDKNKPGLKLSVQNLNQDGTTSRLHH